MRPGALHQEEIQPIPDLAGSSDTPSTGTGVALALTRGGDGPAIGLRVPAAGPPRNNADHAADLHALAAALEGSSVSPWSVGWGASGIIELTGPGSGASS